MKKLIIGFLLIFFSLSSCKKALDSQVPEHSTLDANVITNEKSAATALVGVYSYLSDGQYWEWQYNRDFSHLAGTTRGSGSSSGGQEAGFEGDQMFNTMESTKSTLFNARWQGAYKMILASNWMIKLTEEVPETEFAPNRKRELLSEAHFLRFFAHFYLMRTFSYFWDIASPYGLIYRTEPVNLDNHKQARLSVADSYNMLIADLDYCIANGPAFSEDYRASKVTAMAFKTKLLAMRGMPEDQAHIIKLADSVINSGNFMLEPDLKSVFAKRHTSKEVIFERYISPLTLSSSIGTVRARYNTYYRATTYLLDIVQTSPQYLKSVADTILVGTAMRTGTVGKIASFGIAEEELVANSYTNYLRLAEMYLLKAEAIARSTGNAGEVCTILNKFLIRAQDTDAPLIAANYTTKPDLLEVVYETMLKELCMESGLDFESSFRFIDVATGFRKIIIQKQNLSSEDDVKKAIMPIPIQELLVNIKLEQNPGYIGR